MMAKIATMATIASKNSTPVLAKKIAALAKMKTPRNSAINAASLMVAAFSFRVSFLVVLNSAALTVTGFVAVVFLAGDLVADFLAAGFLAADFLAAAFLVAMILTHPPY